nr:RHS repeat-associated core domain-containing protein [Nannocystis sp. RBIL2]
MIYDVDLAGERVRVEDPSQNVTTYKRNSLGWLLEENDPDRGNFTYTRDLAGNETLVVNAEKTSVETEYDVLGRPSLRRYERATGESRKVAYTYDEVDASHGAGRGRLTTVQDSSVKPCTDSGGSATIPALSYKYEPRGNVVSTTECTEGDLAVTIGASYDALGRLAATIYPDGEQVDYAYDEGGRLRSVKNTADGVTYVELMGYTLDGDLREVKLGNGTGESFTYTPERRFLSSAKIVEKGGGAVYEATYHHYADGLVKDDTATGPYAFSHGYQYDGQDRLVRVTGSNPEVFAFDRIGNLVKTSAHALTPYPSGPGKRNVHALLSAGPGTSFTYDDAGFLKSATLGGVTRTYAWNELDLLASVSFAGETTSFVYDATGARVQKKTSKGTLYSFSPFYEVTEKAAVRTPVKHYLGGARRVAHREGSGVVGALTFHHQDRLGSVVALTDDKGVAMADSLYQYSAYGVSLGVPAKAKPEHARGFQFTGQRQDVETSPDPGAGLVYLSVRYLDPALARFHAPDSVVPQDTIMGFNRYAYASGNPISRVDPGGNADKDVSPQGAYTAPVSTPNQSIHVGPRPLTPAETDALDAALQQQRALGSYVGAERGGDFFAKLTPDYLSAQFSFGFFSFGFTATHGQAYVNFGLSNGVSSMVNLANGAKAARDAKGGLSSLTAFSRENVGISLTAGRLLNAAPTRQNVENFLGGSGQGVSLGGVYAGIGGALNLQQSGSLTAGELSLSLGTGAGRGSPVTADGSVGYSMLLRDTGEARVVPVNLVFSSGATVPAFMLDPKETPRYISREDIASVFR